MAHGFSPNRERRGGPTVAYPDGERSGARRLFDLSGQTALVTGGTTGLGRDMCEAFAEYGASIVVTSRDGAKAEAAASEMARAYSVEALGIEMEQRSFDSVREAARKAVTWKGGVDVLVNNAGGGSGASKGDLFERSVDDIVGLIETNLTGVIYCCREVGRPMRDRGSGRIINVASIAGLVGRDRTIYEQAGINEQPVDYAAAKAGVLGLTRDLAAKLAPFGVRVNAISPGGFDKGLLPEGFVRDYSNRTALGRMGRIGSDIKGVALFLASEASAYVTGQNFVVDGGFSLWK